MKQAQAIRVMMSGDSVFLTGPPGSGKTHTLNSFISHAKKAGKRLAVTASTGIAATHIGGVTIHSWSGLGIRDSVTDKDKQWLMENTRLIKRYNSVDTLIIDEVSMLHGARLDMISQVAKWLRDDDRPFGGLQVVLTGDLFQLPPINRGGASIDFAHTSEAWQELQPKICYLMEQHRQDDTQLLDVLNAMRAGEVHEAHFDMLSERLGREPSDGLVITKLYSHNEDVESINISHLQAIAQEAQIFKMESSGAESKVAQLLKSVLAPEVLELKIGAEVMFVVNKQFDGFVNGSRGTVVEFRDDGAPMVRLQRNGRIIAVSPHSWVLEEDGRRKAEVLQLPLRLAWAITIHKSQGMSLDSAEIDLSRAFTPGMGYVALSRVRSMDGVYLKGINNTALVMHQEIFTYDAELRQLSGELAGGISDEEYVLEVVEKKADEVQHGVDAQLLDILRQWRQEEGKARSIPLYMVASNSTLEALATSRPATIVQLQAISGIGPKMTDRYGDALLSIIRAHLGVHSVPGTDAAEIRRSVRNFFEEGASLVSVCEIHNVTADEAWSMLREDLQGSGGM